MTLRIGLVGTGHWARATQATVLARHPGVEFAGVWGRDPAKAADLAGAFGVRAYPTPEEMFADVAAVAFAVPPDVQAGLAVTAASAGRHLLLDKPVALDPAKADRLVAAVGAAGVASVVFFTRRFLPAVDDFLRGARASDGWLGASASILGSIFQPDSPFRDSPWRREHGGLWDVGPHALSLVLPVLGPAEAVTAVDDALGSSYLTLRHRGGTVSRLALGLDVPPSAKLDEFVLYGRDGYLPLPPMEIDPLAALTRAVDRLVAEAGAGGVGARAGGAGAAAGDSGDGGAGPCDVRFGRDVVAILAAAERSRRTGRLVQV